MTSPTDRSFTAVFKNYRPVPSQGGYDITFQVPMEPHDEWLRVLAILGTPANGQELVVFRPNKEEWNEAPGIPSEG